MYSVKKLKVLSALVVSWFLLHFQGVQLVDGQGLSEVVVKLWGVFYQHKFLLFVICEYFSLSINRLNQLFLLFALLSDEFLVLQINELDVWYQVHFALNFHLNLVDKGAQILLLLTQIVDGSVQGNTFFGDLPCFLLFEVQAFANVSNLVFSFSVDVDDTFGLFF